MAIELPSEVGWFLNFIGVPWININEDKVRAFAGHVRDFAANLTETHQDATATLTRLGSGYSGSAYEALMAMWSAKSTRHITELVDGCHVLATALDAGADFIQAQKYACIGELAGMAAAFVADQAAAFVTFGASEAALPLIEQGATKLMQFTEQQLEQYIIGQIVNAALKPLIDKMSGMAQALVLKSESGALGVSLGQGYSVDLDHVEQHAALMRGHAETITGHVSAFTGNVRALDFTT